MATLVGPNVPAMAPPPGVKSNFIDPPSKKRGIIILEGIFIPLMALSVLARVYVRTRITKLWGIEDTTCLLAAAGSIAHMIIYTQTFPLGFGRHLWDVRAITLLDPSSDRVLSAPGVAYPWAICFAKISILFLYKRLFGVNNIMRIAVWVGVVLDAVLYTAMASLSIGGMVICTGLAQADNSFCKFNESGMVMFTSVVNVVTDFYILILPLPRILTLQVNKRRKIGLILVFASGLGACATSLARLINFSIHYHSKDILWVQGLNAEFTVVEMNIAIVVASASCFPSFFGHLRLVSSSMYRSATRLFTNSHRSGSEPSLLPEASQQPKINDHKWRLDQPKIQRVESYDLEWSENPRR